MKSLSDHQPQEANVTDDWLWPIWGGNINTATHEVHVPQSYHITSECHFTLSDLQTNADTFENILNADEKARNKPPHLYLHCLPFDSDS